ncbi:MBL fold metallo-hydrolase [Marinibactrum halimedae]|uniref:Metallo-beta-lactamase domain-containing protein n=1 Tax=Marinibactrum halimedae TaxID=1444977 RepID=A0AA37T7I3_9GAMM|nr:MBL fold metallo-hydrolase [Marinibactrum halimedae]MCD9458375.1 MBL fold metallo-hydrolase [Marinibactrum halimedae]GLS26072.1 hypothetical protein GCM10007877_17870 [Marinibactrum halimedae]
MSSTWTTLYAESVELKHNITPSISCDDTSFAIQILGAGGPELEDQHHSSSYLIWHNQKARVLIDAGSGSSTQFNLAKATFSDLTAIALTHLHVDHSSDLPAYAKGAHFTRRRTRLPLYGPAGNDRMPATTEFLQRLFGEKGAYPYLSDTLPNTMRSSRTPSKLTGQESKSNRKNGFYFDPVDVPLDGKIHTYTPMYKDDDRQRNDRQRDKESNKQHGENTANRTSSQDNGRSIQLSAISTHHGPIPAVGWRVDINGCSIIVTGDSTNQWQHLTTLSADADLLVAHVAIPENAHPVAATLHMRPSQIGQLAHAAGAKRLLLSHFMRRTLPPNQTKAQILAAIRQHYSGPICFGQELKRYYPAKPPHTL